MFNNTRKHRPQKIHFEIIPMIDVMMILVLFLSVMAFLPQVQSTIKPDVPPAQGDSDVTGDDVILAMKLEPGATTPMVLLDDEPLAESELIDKVRAAAAANPKGRVVIAADKTMSYNAVIQMLVRLRNAKIPKVVLATSKE